jgi:predicted  nucleic acid-binding Zn-ribbon protein
MPHQCTNCGHTFADGSKEMLSGCPECGGNKFQFRPAGSVDDAASDGTPDSADGDEGGLTDAAARAGAAVRDRLAGGRSGSTEPRDTEDASGARSGETSPTENSSAPEPSTSASPASDTDAGSAARSEAASTPGDAGSTGDTGSTSADADADRPLEERSWPGEETRDETATSDAPTESTETAGTADTTAGTSSPEGTADRTPEEATPERDEPGVGQGPDPAPRPEEDRAQADARTDVVSDDEITAATDADTETERTPPAANDPDAYAADPDAVEADAAATDSASSPDAAPPPDADGTVIEPESEERPDLTDLREELNDQFESIKIVNPGQYELNLMELYDREEYIISLQEDGKYVIEVPDRWQDDEE